MENDNLDKAHEIDDRVWEPAWELDFWIGMACGVFASILCLAVIVAIYLYGF